MPWQRGTEGTIAAQAFKRHHLEVPCVEMILPTDPGRLVFLQDLAPRNVTCSVETNQKGMQRMGLFVLEGASFWVVGKGNQKENHKFLGSKFLLRVSLLLLGHGLFGFRCKINSKSPCGTAPPTKRPTSPSLLPLRAMDT